MKLSQTLYMYCNWEEEVIMTPLEIFSLYFSGHSSEFCPVRADFIWAECRRGNGELGHHSGGMSAVCFLHCGCGPGGCM